MSKFKLVVVSKDQNIMLQDDCSKEVFDIDGHYVQL